MHAAVLVDPPRRRSSSAKPSRRNAPMPALPQLYAHPFSSYCQKVLVALYENGTPFELRMLEDPQAQAELAARWPIKRFPVLVDGERTIL
jgi:glutathione S-transferase